MWKFGRRTFYKGFLIEGQAHVGMPRGAEMSWALNDPK